jgi:hypothetical protein
MPVPLPRDWRMSEQARSSRRSRKSFASALARLEEAVDRACSPQEAWPTNVIAAVGAGLRFAADDPRAAQLLVIDAAAGPDCADVHRQMIDSFAERLRAVAGEHGLLAAGMEDVLITGVIGMVAIRLTLGQARTLPTVTLEMSEFLFAPYLGDERKRRLIAGAIDLSLSGRS